MRVTKYQCGDCGEAGRHWCNGTTSGWDVPRIQVCLTDAEEKRVRADEREKIAKAIEELTEAIRYTVEYVGPEMLPPIEGWAWWDAMVKYAPEKAARIARNWGGDE